MFIKSKGVSRKASISLQTLNLVKFFISSNSAFIALQNPYLRAIICPSIHLNCYFTFRYTILNDVRAKMKEQITRKLKAGVFVCLIPDGWTSTTPRIGYLGESGFGADYLTFKWHHSKYFTNL